MANGGLESIAEYAQGWLDEPGITGITAAAGTGGLLSGIGGMAGGLAGLLGPVGLAAAAIPGIASMFGGGGSIDTGSAISGGTQTTGLFAPTVGGGVPSWIWIIAGVLALIWLVRHNG